MVRTAGATAEGFEAVFPYDPLRDDPNWLAFRERFQKRFDAAPDAFASLGYDGMNTMLQAICKAGLNRAGIRDALYGLERYKGVTGQMIFDPNAKNIAPLYLATVKDGKISYRHYGMTKEYARVGENGVSYNGPALPDLSSGPLKIGLFGPGADQRAAALNQAGSKFSVVGISSEVPWGKASSELVKLIYDGHLLALISMDRNASHLAEQLAIKAFVPLIALSADRSLTDVNIPWIFRLPPETPLQDVVAGLTEAAAKAGPNRARLREVLASGTTLAGRLSFDTRGEPK